MRTLLMAIAMTLWASVAWAQETPPPECRYDAAGRIDYVACAAVAPVGSPWRSLSLMNLGTQAFLAADYAGAVRFYDEAQPTDGSTFYSDASYHAYRAAALHAVGRPDEAIIEARRSLAVLRNDPELPEAVRERFASIPVDRELVLAALLPVLHAARDPATDSVRNEYLAIPARDWISWANRAGVLEQLGAFDAALSANAEALRQQPDHPAVLNNQCYILTRALRADEAISYCERARAAAPDIGAIRHSVASAYAAVGRCEEAERELGEARRLDPASLAYQRPLVCTPR